MKQFITLIFLCLQINLSFSQADVSAGFALQGSVLANSPVTGRDDWFPRTPGVGKGVIDTSGVGGYIVNILANKSYSFVKRMAFPLYSVRDNRLYIDALYCRDGNVGSVDSTVMLGSDSKNCANPMTEWYGGGGGVGSTSNDIVDMFAHARRDGTSINDSLWIYGGVTFVGAGGAHYFDYEFYQSEMGFAEPPLWTTVRFTNSGAEEGHTAWRFNSAGNVIKAGDMIVAVSFDNAGVNSVELRIWVSENDRNTIVPTRFSWGAAFDKKSNANQYGYASINFPSSNLKYAINTGVLPIPAAPWGTINGGPVYSPVLQQYKFFEFGLNITSLGIDPKQIAGSDPCSSPFSKLLVKSRTGNSFTADLKDFVGPYDFMKLPVLGVNIGPDRQICVGRDTALLYANPSAGALGIFHWTSVYGDGIISNPDSSAIYVNMPGIYIVQSYIYPGCFVSSTDTVIVSNMGGSCAVLPQNNIVLRGNTRGANRWLSWPLVQDPDAASLELQYSRNGREFHTLAVLPKKTVEYTDKRIINTAAYYRIVSKSTAGHYKSYSNVIMLHTKEAVSISIQKLTGQNVVKITSAGMPFVNGSMMLFDETGKLVYTTRLHTSAASDLHYIHQPLTRGVYYYRLITDVYSGSGKILWD